MALKDEKNGLRMRKSMAKDIGKKKMKKIIKSITVVGLIVVLLMTNVLNLDNLFLNITKADVGDYIYFDATLSKMIYDGTANDEGDNASTVSGITNIMPKAGSANIYAKFFTELPVESGRLYIDASNISDVDYIDSIELKPDGYGVGITLVPMGSGYFESNVDISGYSSSPSSGYIYVKYKDGTTKTSAHYTGYDLKGDLMGHVISFTSTNPSGAGISVANASSFTSSSVLLTKESEYTEEINGYSHTWRDVYKAEIPSGNTYKYVFFYSSTDINNVPGDSSRTTLQPMPTVENQCFYADTSDAYIYDDDYRDGYWDTVYSIRDSETGKGKQVVDIAASDFDSSNSSDRYTNTANPSDTFYINSTFYDYYSDYEMNGLNRDDYGSHILGQRNWVTFREFDQALSDYYSANATDIPIYTGHFQPNEFDGSYVLFQYLATNLNLYGFSSKTDNQALYYKFMSTNNSNADINGNTAMYSYALQGLVGNTLVDGELKTRDLSVSYSDYTADENNTSTGVNMPHFDSDFLNGNNSKNTKIGNVYENVAFPFTKYYMNSSGEVNKTNTDTTGVYYWTFNSADTTLAIRENSNSSNSPYDYYLKTMPNSDWSKNVNSASQTSGVSSTYGFFPFNETSSGATASTYNYGYGTKMEFEFSLTPDGTVLGTDGNYYPIEFRFSGDDDVWVFIDDKLVLDVGGAHGQVSGVLNFRDMTSTVYGTGVKNGVGRTVTNGAVTDDFSITGAKTGKHKISIYYMERGMWESNMTFMFNFVDNNELEVTKEIDTDTNNVSNEFVDLIKDNETFTFNILNQATHYGSYNGAASGAGFVVNQYEIRDYGSASSGDLEIAEGAIYNYTDDETTTNYTVDSEGNFTLGCNQSVTFREQFRRGSYISLTEMLTDVDKNLYDTTYTVTEFDQDKSEYVEVSDNLKGTTSGNTPVTVYSRYGGSDLTINTGNSTGLIGQTGLSVEDYRVEVYDPTTQQTNVYASSSDTSDPSFVFRSYMHPDEEYLSLDLNMKFINTVKTGGISVTKSQANTSDADLDPNQEYVFYIAYSNIGGKNIGGTTLYRKVVLKNGETWTSDGIPVGTQYTIYEVIPSDESQLYSINGDSDYLVTPSAINSTDIDGNVFTIDKDTPYTVGTITEAQTNVAEYSNYNFANYIDEKVDFSLKKLWHDVSSITSLPQATFVLKRKVKDADDSTYKYLSVETIDHVDGYFIGGEVEEPIDWDACLIKVNDTNSTVTNEVSGDVSWSIELKDLDKYLDGSLTSEKENNAYIYQIVEVTNNSGTYTEVTDGMSIMLDGKDYTVSYGNNTVLSTEMGSVVSEFDVTNTHVEEGVTLPEVGGRGILNLLVIGMIIMMTSVFGVLRLDRD